MSEPDRYGIVTFDKNKHAVSIEKSPKKATLRSLEYISLIKKSSNMKELTLKELEITDINKKYFYARN